MLERSITKTEFVRILSRAFAVYLLVWGLSDCLTLPELIYSFLKYFEGGSVLARHDYWTNYYLFRVISESIRTVVLLTFSVIFWRNWKTVGRLFMGSDDNSEAPLDSQASEV